jgi:hypothetical protein
MRFEFLSVLFVASVIFVIAARQKRKHGRGAYATVKAIPKRNSSVS